MKYKYLIKVKLICNKITESKGSKLKSQYLFAKRAKKCPHKKSAITEINIIKMDCWIIQVIKTNKKQLLLLLYFITYETRDARILINRLKYY